MIDLLDVVCLAECAGRVRGHVVMCMCVYCQSRSSASVECSQVNTYNGHRDGVWHVTHARNGTQVIGTASAGKVWSDVYMCTIKGKLKKKMVQDVMVVRTVKVCLTM